MPTSYTTSWGTIYYNLKKLGLSPLEMNVGCRVLITAEAAADWRRDREAATN